MTNLQTAPAVDQATGRDTPKRRATSAWAQACTAAVRDAPRRRLHGGWKRLDQGTDLAALIVHRSGRAYTARHVRNGLAEAEAMGLIEVRRHREQRADGTWQTKGLNAYRVVSAKRRRAGQADRKSAAPHALSPVRSGLDLSHVTHDDQADRALRPSPRPECPGCGVPEGAARHLWPCIPG